MNALSILVMVGLLACNPGDTGSQGGGGYEPPVETEEPEAKDPGPEHDHTGSMCDLYGGDVMVAEMEDGTVLSLPVPVLCDPHDIYTGYPADRPGDTLPVGMVRVMRAEIE